MGELDDVPTFLPLGGRSGKQRKTIPLLLQKNSKNWWYGLIYILPKRYIQELPVPENVTLFGNRMSTEGIRLK